MRQGLLALSHLLLDRASHTGLARLPSPPPARAPRRARVQGHRFVVERVSTMSFFGAVVRPGKAVPYMPPPEPMRLHLSQVPGAPLPRLSCAAMAR